MIREYPNHFHDFRDLRQRATAKLVEKLAPSQGREENAARAVTYTLGLYSLVMTGENFPGFLKSLLGDHPPSSIYADPAGRKMAREKYPDIVNHPALDDFPVMELALEKNKQGWDKTRRLVERLTAADHIAFSQSPASGLPTWFVGEMIKTNSLELDGKPTVLDLCGAPGNKTLNLINELPGQDITAVINDPKSHRSTRVEERLTSFGFEYRPKDDSFRRTLPDGKKATVFVTRADASDQKAVEEIIHKNFGGKPPNIILADVPCPGDGRIQTNPSSAVRRQPKTEADVCLQTAILQAAVANVRPEPRGTVIYSTCSVNPRIDEAVVETVIGGSSGIKCVELATDDVNLWPEDGESCRSGMVRGVRTFPQALKEGFFCAALVRD